MGSQGESARAGFGRPLTSTFAGLLVAAAATAFCVAGCHPRAAPEEGPVAIGVPQQVSDKVENAQLEMIGAVAGLASDYDQAVCGEKGQMAERSHGRQARAEAQLEVHRALSEASSQSDRRRGGGPADDGGDIVIIEEPEQKTTDRGDWQCMESDAQPQCAQAAATSVSHQVFRRHIDGYDLNPTTTGDVMEALAAEIAWGSERLTAATDRDEALTQIEEDCQGGDSPLARFFVAAESFEHREVRQDLLRLRDDFVGKRRGVCQALPSFYDSLMSELNAEMTRRTRSGQCSAQRWDAVWGE